MAKEKLEELYTQGIIPSDLDVQTEIQNQIEILSKKSDLFVELTQKIIADQLDTKFYVTNEDLDTTVTVQNLISMLNVAPEYREATVKAIYDLMGLPQPKQNQMPQESAQGAAQTIPTASLQGITTNSVTPQLA